MMLFNANASLEAPLKYPDHVDVNAVAGFPRCKNDLLSLTGG